MLKKLLNTTILSLLFGLFALSAYAATSTLVVRVEQPKTPTNQNSFELNFVALDTNNNTVTVRCYKKSPSDGSFVQFDGDKALQAGGNSGSCAVDGNILSSVGTYQFKVIATSNIVSESSIVSVSFDSSAPGTPNSYSKEKTGNCEYTIKFKTDADDGKTVKVALYRSTETSFTADGTSQVDTRNVGSDLAVEIKNNVPDCNRTYYYAVRAFNAAGVGSGVISDTNTIITSSSTTTASTPGTTGALGSTTVQGTGAILSGDSTINPETTPTVEPTPEVIPSDSSVLGSSTNESMWNKPLFKFALAALAIGLLILLAQRRKK